MLNSLSEEERQTLIAAVTELRSRGVEIPEHIKRKLQERKGELAWPLSPSGYFNRASGRPFTPNEVQERFIASRARYLALISGRGGGKTCSGVQKALKKIKAGESGMVLNYSFEMLKTSTWPELREWIPWNMVVPRHRVRSNPAWEPQKPFTLVFMNGARMIVKGLKDPESARGPNMNWLWYDEAGMDDTGMAWTLAIAGVRIGNEPQAWITTTPKGKDHWIYKFFVEQEITKEAQELFSGTEDRPLVEFYTTSIDDNKANLDPGFYASMVAAYPTGWLRSRELDGLFVDEGGVLGNVEWFKNRVIYIRPSEAKKRVRYWDLAASEKKILKNGQKNDPDDTVGTLMSWDGHRNFTIEDQVSGMWTWETILEKMVETARLDGVNVQIWVEQEPASGGVNQIAAIRKYFKDLIDQGKLYREFTIYSQKPEGDKIIRANHWFAEAAQGQFWIVNGLWNSRFYAQLASFPLGRHDDLVDGVSGARSVIAPIHKWRQMEFLHV